MKEKWQAGCTWEGGARRAIDCIFVRADFASLCMVVSTACAAFTCHTGEFHSDDLFVVVVGLHAVELSCGTQVAFGEHFLAGQSAHQPGCC